MRPAMSLPLVVALATLGPAAAHAAKKAIDKVGEQTFSFGAMAIGQSKDLDYARAEGLGIVPASPLDDYLAGVLARLLAGSPVKAVPAHVYVRAGGDWAARSTADANIYVSLGILLRLDNEDEVAAVLGHEVSHVILGHANSDVVQGAQQRAIQLSALAAESQQALTAVGVTAPSGGGASVAAQAHVEDQSRALLLNTTLLSPSWTRGQERDADRLGADLMVRAGYSPQGMVSLLQKQKSFETERAANPQAAALDQKLLGVDVTQKGQAQVAKVTQKTGSAASLLNKLAGVALGKAKEVGNEELDTASRSHPQTEERIEEIKAYIDREYPGLASGALKVEPWEAAKDVDATADLLENYIAAIQAKDKLSAGDVASARNLARSGVSGPTHAHSYPNYVEAAVQVADGSGPKALGDYETAIAGPEPAGAIFSSASLVLLQMGQRDKAVEVIEAGYSRFQEPPSLTVPLIRTYQQAARQADADRVAKQCGLRWPDMQKTCMDAAKGL